MRLEYDTVRQRESPLYAAAWEAEEGACASAAGGGLVAQAAMVCPRGHAIEKRKAGPDFEWCELCLQGAAEGKGFLECTGCNFGM